MLRTLLGPPLLAPRSFAFKGKSAPWSLPRASGPGCFVFSRPSRFFVSLARNAGARQVGRRAGFFKRLASGSPQGAQAVEPRSLKDWFSLRVHTKLRFDNFPKHKGHWGTLGTILLINCGVFVAWQLPKTAKINEKWFLWTNVSESSEWLSQCWSTISASFSHQDWGHLTGNMALFLYLGKRIHQLVGRARFVYLYLLGGLGGSLATQASPRYSPEEVSKTATRSQQPRHMHFMLHVYSNCFNEGISI